MRISRKPKKARRKSEILDAAKRSYNDVFFSLNAPIFKASNERSV